MYKLSLLVLVALLGMAFSASIDVDPEEDLSDYDDEGRGIKETIKEKFEKFLKKCHCEGNGCECTGKFSILKLYKVEGSLGFEMVPAEKAIRIILKVNGKEVLKKTVSVKRAERVCDRAPKPVNKLKFCLLSTFDESEEDGIVSCSTLQCIFGKDVVFAEFKFGCIQYKDQKVQFNLKKHPDHNGIVQLNIKNPISSLKELIG